MNSAAIKITNDDIRALKREAAMAGDSAQVKLCEQALDGDAAAREACAEVIDDAREIQLGLDEADRGEGVALTAQQLEHWATTGDLE